MTTTQDATSCSHPHNETTAIFRCFLEWTMTAEEPHCNLPHQLQTSCETLTPHATQQWRSRLHTHARTHRRRAHAAFVAYASASTRRLRMGHEHAARTPLTFSPAGCSASRRLKLARLSSSGTAVAPRSVMRQGAYTAGTSLMMNEW